MLLKSGFNAEQIAERYRAEEVYILKTRNYPIVDFEYWFNEVFTHELFMYRLGHGHYILVGDDDQGLAALHLDSVYKYLRDMTGDYDAMPGDFTCKELQVQWLKPGYGFWDCTVYPIGGSFCRAKDPGLPLIRRNSANAHGCDSVGLALDGRRVAFNSQYLTESIGQED